MTRLPSPKGRASLSARLLQNDERGTSAVEFALLLPVFLLILVGLIDFGGVLYKKFRLNAAVSAGANYALVHASDVGASGGGTLATSIASIMTSSSTAESTSGTVVINNGPTATLSAGATSTGGTAANAESCYCPSLSGGTLAWGTAQTCGGTCSAGGIAGRFVSISAQQAYTPSFSNYGLVENGTISSSVVVQAR